MVAQVCNLRIRGAEMGGRLQGQGQSGLHGEIQTSQNYQVKCSLKQTATFYMQNLAKVKVWQDKELHGSDCF